MLQLHGCNVSEPNCKQPLLKRFGEAISGITVPVFKVEFKWEIIIADGTTKNLNNFCLNPFIGQVDSAVVPILYGALASWKEQILKLLSCEKKKPMTIQKFKYIKTKYLQMV